MAATERAERVIAVVGGVVLTAYVLQARLGLAPAWLLGLQANDTYKTITGLVLASYLAFQWAVASRRQWDPGGAVLRHKIAGALAPVVLYLHASRFGYGYLLLLGTTYLSTTFLGLLHRTILENARSLYTAWFVVHVSTAVLLVALGGYHVVIALAYE